jgi:hypothetical protein
VKTSDATIAASMRSVVRNAYSGRFDGSSEIGFASSVEMGAIVWWKPMAAIAITQMINGNAMKSQRLGSTRHADALAVRLRLKPNTSIRRPSRRAGTRACRKPSWLRPRGTRRDGPSFDPESGNQA